MWEEGKNTWSISGQLLTSIKISKTREPQWGEVAWLLSSWVAGNVFIKDSHL